MKALVVDPEPQSRDALRRVFQDAGAQVRGVSTVSEARRHLAELAPDVVVAALDAAGEGQAFLEEAIRQERGRVGFALVDPDRLEAAVEAMARGARDFLWRPISSGRANLLLARLTAEREREEFSEALRIDAARKQIALSLTGASARWKSALAAIEREAALDATILLTGEPGTEKEAAARALHSLSRRGGEAFRVPPGAEELEAALSGAGTVFVPALERLPDAVHQCLLGQLARRSGSARLVLACDEDPTEAVLAGRFPAALLEAVVGHVVHLPPLRERREDIDLLGRRFLAQIDASLYFDPQALDVLSAHDWPGNVRELERVVRRAARLADGLAIGPTAVLSVLAGAAAAKRRARLRKPPVVRVPVGASLADVERRLIQKTLEFVRGNKPRAAALLKLSLKTIYNKIKEYGLEH